VNCWDRSNVDDDRSHIFIGQPLVLGVGHQWKYCAAVMRDALAYARAYSSSLQFPPPVSRSGVMLDAAAEPGKPWKAGTCPASSIPGKLGAPRVASLSESDSSHNPAAQPSGNDPAPGVTARFLGPMNGRQPMVKEIPTTSRRQNIPRLMYRIFPALFMSAAS